MGIYQMGIIFPCVLQTTNEYRRVVFQWLLSTWRAVEAQRDRKHREMYDRRVVAMLLQVTVDDQARHPLNKEQGHGAKGSRMKVYRLKPLGAALGGFPVIYN